MALLTDGGMGGPVDANGRPLQPRKKRLSLGAYEAKSSKTAWAKKQQADQTKRRMEEALRSFKEAEYRLQGPSITEVNSRLARYERQRAAYEKRTKVRPRGGTFKFESTTKSAPNPFITLFSDVERVNAHQLMQSLRPHVRAVVTMALDPRDTLPLTGMGEETRSAVAGARQGNFADLARLVQSNDMLDEVTSVGQGVIGTRFAEQRRRIEQLDRPPAPRVHPAVRLQRESDINAARDSMQRFREIERGLPKVTFEQPPEGAAEPFRTTIRPEGRPLPEDMKGDSERVALKVRSTGYLAKLKTEYFPDDPNVRLELSESGENVNAVDAKGNFLRNFPMPSRVVEVIHGQSVAEDFAIYGHSALPSDTPLFHKPSIGRATLEVLEFAGGVADEPRKQVKKRVIEPILPDFKVKVPFEEVASRAFYVVPPLGLADLALTGLQHLGVDVPTLSGTLRKVLPKDITITDEVVAELTSFVLDPLNLIPGLGFGKEIAGISTRLALRVAGQDVAKIFAEQGAKKGLAALTSKAGEAALVKLGRDPEFITAAGRSLRLLRSEEGFIRAGGERGALEARQKVLQDMVKGIETSDPNLLPVRRELDDVWKAGEVAPIEPVAGATEKVSQAQLREEANRVQDVLGFGDKQRLQQLGVDPQTLDDIHTVHRLYTEAPQMLRDNPELLKFAREVEANTEPAVLRDLATDSAIEKFGVLDAGSELPNGSLYVLPDGRIIKVGEGYAEHWRIAESLETPVKKVDLGPDAVEDLVADYLAHNPGARHVDALDELVAQGAIEIDRAGNPVVMGEANSWITNNTNVVNSWLDRTGAARVSSIPANARIEFADSVASLAIEVYRPLTRAQREAFVRAAGKVKADEVFIDVSAGYLDNITGMSGGNQFGIRRFLDDLDRVPPKEWVGRPTADEIQELKSAAAVTGEKKATWAQTQLDEVETRLGELQTGEQGGGRLRPLKVDDQVEVVGGSRAGEQGTVTAVIKGGKTLEVTLESGQVVKRAPHQLNALEKLPAEVSGIPQELPLATRTRLERAAEIEEQLVKVGPKERKALQAELDGLNEQATLAETLRRSTEPGGPLAERASQLDELNNLKQQLARVKGEGRKAPLRRQVAALEEAMGLGRQPAIPDPIEEIKQAYLASQADVLGNLQRRSDELDFLLKKRGGVLTGEEAERFAAQQDEVIEEMARLRSETDDAAEYLIRGAQKMKEGEITPKTLTLADYVQFAFSRSSKGELISNVSPAGKFVRATLGRIPILGRGARLYDPSLYHASNFIGRHVVALGKLLNSLDSSSETAYLALLAKGSVFDTKLGIEAKTGKALSDVIEHWDEYKHMFGSAENEYVQLLDRTRLEAIRDMRELGVFVPNAWDEVQYVFRHAIGKDGLDYRGILAGAGRTKPGSFRARIYEMMEEGLAKGVAYDQDLNNVYYTSVRAMREYAANQAFLKAVKLEKGVPLKLFVAQEHRLNAALAAREYAWTKVTRLYAHQSVRGTPAKPVLRASRLYDLEPPEELARIIDRVAELNRGTRTPQSRAELRQLRDEVDALASRNSARLKAARSEYRTARESVNTQVTEGTRFGLPGKAVEVAPAPFRDFPELSGRLYLRDDIQYLTKVAGRNDNPFIGLARGAAKVSGVFKTGQTAFDPGFWFIQGLGAMGLDFVRSTPGVSLLAGKVLPDLTANPFLYPLLKPLGRSNSIWGEAMWRSLVGLVGGRVSAEYWTREAAMHADEWAEFIQRGSVLSGHSGYSDEVIAELVQGGLIERFEERIPGINKLHPVKRVGNAFSNFMNAASWETWKALRPLAKNDHEVEELAAFVRNISGRNSARALGISQGQEMVERSLVYAREYTRATTAVLAKAVFDPASFGGRQAIKSLAGIGTAMTMVFGGVTLLGQLEHNGWDMSKIDWDDLAGDLKDTWNPLGPSFMARRMGKTFFGIGGGMRSLVSTVAKLGAAGYYDAKRIKGDDTSGKPTLNPINLDDRVLVNWQNPMIRFLRGKSSPVVGTAWDLVSGKDYLGFAMDDPKDYWKLPTQLFPFAAQAAIDMHGKGLKERSISGVVEWFGLKTVPVSGYQLYKEAAEKELGDKWSNLQGTDLLKLAELDKEHYPELYAAKQLVDEEQRMKGNTWQAAEDLVSETKRETERKLVPLAVEVNWGRPGGGKVFSDQYKYHSTQASNDFSIAARAMGIDPDEFSNSSAEGKDALLENQVGALDPLDYRKADNSIDWDAYNQAKDSLLLQMSPANRAAYEEKKFNVNNPQLEKTLRLRSQAQDDLQAYLDIPKYSGLDNDQSKQVDDLIDLADMVRGQLSLSGIDLSRATFFQFLLETKWKGYAGSDNPAILYTAFASQKDALRSLVRGTAKRDFMFAHPNLPVFYDFIFDDMDEEEQEEWINQFGTRSSSQMIGVGLLD